MNKTVATAAAAVGVVLLAAALASVLEPSPDAVGTSSSVSVGAMFQGGAGATPTVDASPGGIEDATGDEQGELVTVELDDPETTARLERIAAQVVALAHRSTFDEVFEAARAQGPVDLLVALESHLRDRPQDWPRLLEVMAAERDSQLLFAMARVLGRLAADPDVRQATLSLLRGLEADRQQVALVVLLGRTEPEVLGFAFDLLERGDTDGVRARAASLLAHVLPDLSPADAQRAQSYARGLLTSFDASPPLTAAAAELLGAPGADPADVVLLHHTLDRSPDGATYSSVAQSLALTGLDPDEVLDVFRATADDSTAPAEVREIARTLLAGAEAHR